ncbi:MAG: helix-turn-helix transcriptional regulator [Terriglobia bacterium]|nr:helix-turn-helix transcriptional regulator [Terriglobia bacterium]
MTPAPSPEAGKRLKAERLRVRLSTREVEKLSQQIAQERGSQEYRISDSWLAQVENGEFTPSIYKLYSLSRIYERDYDEILALFGIFFSEIGAEASPLRLPRTHLVGPTLRETGGTFPAPLELRDKVVLERTNLVHQMFENWGEVPVSLLRQLGSRNTLCGYIGLENRTLYPLIRPGSFVQIDPRQKKIEGGNWQNEFERPIYFLELRESYACSWCQLDGSRLTLIPSPQSHKPVRQLHYPVDAEIIGRVTAVTMRIAEVSGDPSKTSP